MEMSWYAWCMQYANAVWLVLFLFSIFLFSIFLFSTFLFLSFVLVFRFVYYYIFNIIFYFIIETIFVHIFLCWILFYPLLFLFNLITLMFLLKLIAWLMRSSTFQIIDRWSWGWFNLLWFKYVDRWSWIIFNTLHQW